MLNHIQGILLLFLLLLQFVVMFYLLYTTHQKYKADKKFWAKQEEISEEFLKQLKEQPAVFSENTEGDVASEQKDTDKE